MPNQIKELALPAALAVLLLVYPVLVVADTINPMPITAVYSAGEWVVNKITTKPKPSFHSPERQAKFDRWSKEDWIKDDPYACMWDRNWIRKYKQDVCL
jgi:hypothetical protein